MHDTSGTEILPPFPVKKKKKTSPKTDHYTCTSLLAERTHMFSVTPFLTEVCQQFPSGSCALGYNCAPWEPRGNSPLKLQCQVIYCSCLNIWTSDLLYALFIITFLLLLLLPLNYPLPQPPPLLIVKKKEKGDIQTSHYYSKRGGWEEDQEDNATISHHS